ncbi:plastocyanin/azurin family copper-binding protein [Akkermansiaceae bacterium]|nr:plastocyanin/azurin family copper-binding protein [Akkermansiaceae bacterium]
MKLSTYSYLTLTAACTQLSIASPNSVSEKQSATNPSNSEQANSDDELAPSARFVRIELPGKDRILSIAEMEVFTRGRNAAKGRETTQSSTADGGTADRATDGRTRSTWKDNSVTLTNKEDNPWLEVDLRRTEDIGRIKITNRTDEGFEKGLENLTLIFLDSDRKEIYRIDNIASSKLSINIIPTLKPQITYLDKEESAQKPKPDYEIIDGPVHKMPTKGAAPAALNIAKNSHIGFVGGGLGSRMNLFNEFETELQRRYPEQNLYIRNFCMEGDTPAFRPHPSRQSFYVLDTLKDKGKSLVKEEYQKGSGSGHFETPDQWLSRNGIDTVIGFFGYSESFDGTGEEQLDRYQNELRAFIQNTLKAGYTKNGTQLAIVGPAAFEDLSSTYDLPDGKDTNTALIAYTKAMKEVCAEEGILFVDAHTITDDLFKKSEEPLTSNGHNLTSEGYKQFSPLLADSIFGKTEAKNDYETVKKAVAEKNKIWLDYYKIPNGVHVHGRRYKPYGNINYPDELIKLSQMTKVRDSAIWAANKGEAFDIAAADAKTHKLKKIRTNSNRKVDYKNGEEVAKLLKTAEGYKIELFADEKGFPDLQNPSQMAFDNEGRLWVGCMGSYPHWKVGDPEPNDKIIILEDTDNDGKADKQITFVDNIRIPMGFEITEHGVFVSLGKNLVLFKDTNGDSIADYSEVALSGFDDHDTHHAISAFCADPSGAFYMGEGIFLHSNIETPYGPVRGTDGGFYRYNPTKMHLERTAQLAIPNPWGIAFNEWGQNFFLHTSGTSMSWMQQSAIKPTYDQNLKAPDLLVKDRARPTSGLEFVSSRHFPDEVQGDVILCNNIGFLGAKQHSIEDDAETGFFKTSFRHDLFYSPTEYQYFRPVDLEFAPDGSLYFIDWSNVLIGHMQHSARDPKRDHVHGRVYRVTYPSRPLVEPAKIAGAEISQLLENLKLPELRTRYRTRRELRGRDATEVLTAIQKWVTALDKADERYEHHLLEGLWVTWGINKIDIALLEQLLSADSFKARTAAVRAVRYNMDKLPKATEYLINAANDPHPQVRHEAIIQATWIPASEGIKVIDAAKKHPIAEVSKDALKYGEALLKGSQVEEEKEKVYPAGIIKDEEKVTTVQVNCIHEGIKFDVGDVKLKLGKKLKLIFNNPDDMQHNLVIVKPGTADTVAMAAIQLGPDGNKMHWVPKSEDVLTSTKLLNKDEIETIEFTFEKPGKYPFVCTFPGHATLMRGHFIVE